MHKTAKVCGISKLWWNDKIVWLNDCCPVLHLAQNHDSAKSDNNKKTITDAPTKAYACEIDHSNLVFGLIPETRSVWCKERCYLYGKHCQRCQRHFVADAVSNRDNQFKPTLARPAMTCENAAKFAMTSSEQELRFCCDHALCYDCYRTLSAENGDNSRAQRKRRAPARHDDWCWTRNGRRCYPARAIGGLF